MLKIALVGLVLGMAVVGVARAEGDVAKGEEAFKKKCRACHVADKPQNLVGPTLQGVIGRQAGTAPGFTRYSANFKKNMTHVWDAVTLDDYLVDPKAKVPGTAMLIPGGGIKDAAERADIIAYLQANS
jgi:cytochrome c